MSAIARVLLKMGYRVSGSDLNLTGITTRLEKMGAVVYQGHRPENIEGAGLLVVSSAVPKENPEVLAARKCGITVIRRGEMLARLMEARKGIAVAGTHGKTTTTSMISLVLEKAGLDPTVLIGGELNDFGGNAKLGKGGYLVAEADESDGSFLELRPQIAVVTNAEADHLDYYHSLERVTQAFSTFINMVPDDGLAVICTDDPFLRSYRTWTAKKVITYALTSGADYGAVDLEFEGFGSSCTLVHQGKEIGRLKLLVPGKHNIQNALAAVAVGRYLGIDHEVILSALESFGGVQRRFQALGITSGVWVVDDYAHHPTEVAATLEAARQVAGGRIICIFQPHRYTRTKALYREFGLALARADHLFITEIYPAGEAPIPGVTSALIVRSAAEAGRKPRHSKDPEEIIQEVLALAAPGDLVLSMGAGDVYKIGLELLRRLRYKDPEKKDQSTGREAVTG